MIKEHYEMVDIGLNVWAQSEQPGPPPVQPQARWIVSAAGNYKSGVSVKFSGAGYTIEKAYKSAYAKFLDVRPLLLEAKARIERAAAEKSAFREAAKLRREADKLEDRATAPTAAHY